MSGQIPNDLTIKIDSESDTQQAQDPLSPITVLKSLQKHYDSIEKVSVMPPDPLEAVLRSAPQAVL